MPDIRFSLIILTSILIINFCNAQDDDIIVGKTEKSAPAAVYDISDPTGVNIEVNLWGFVRYPGRYRVPINTTFLDLITYAGGPTEYSNLADIRILRQSSDTIISKNKVIKLNYNDLLWSKKIKSSNKNNPVLQAGDVVIIPEEKRYTFREDVSFILPILTTLITISTLVITITRY